MATDIDPRIRNAWQKHNAASPAALHELQQRGMEAFARHGFPSPRLEDWKYTDLRQLTDTWPAWLQTTVHDQNAPTSHGHLEVPDAITVTMTDGRCRLPAESGELPTGMLLSSLEGAAKSHPELLQSCMGRLTRSGHSGLIALNDAFSGQGLFVHIPDGIHLSRPLYIHYHAVTPEITVQPRLVISLGRNSSLQIIEHFSSSAPVIVNAVTEVFCGPGAQLSHSRLQAEHPESWHTSAQFISVGQDASVRTAHAEIGGRMARNELHTALTGRGASLAASGLFMADQQRHVESRITVEHQAPDTRSDASYRGVLADRAHGVFNGRIHVHQAAQKTAAQLSNRNLLLNAGAEIDTKPELEIYADDVKCAHGATTGQLDKQALFYLLSRGIDTTAARHMLITAFVAELLNEQPVRAIRKLSQQALRQLQEFSGS